MAAAVTSGKGEAGRLLITTCPAVAAILGCNLMFSVDHPKSLFEISTISWV
jgi:hypothetical protein